MRVVWLDLLIAFAVLNGWAFAATGLGGLVDYLTILEPFALVTAVDLVLALIVGMTFLAREARARGQDPRPFIVLTLLTGSIGLLAYLARHDRIGGSIEPSQATSEGASSAPGWQPHR